jgi:glycosyltransferase 2 family protein
VSNKASVRRWAIAAAKVLVVLLVFWFVRGTIVKGFNDLKAHPLTIHYGWLTLSAVLYGVGLLPAALFWRRILHVLGQEVSLIDTLRAYYIGHLGKYVPGKAMVIVLRAGLIRGQRVNMAVATASVFFETLLMISVGTFWAAAILALWHRENAFLCLLSLGLMVACGLPTTPPLFGRLARLAGVGRSDPEVAAKMARLSWRSFGEGFLAMTVCWVLLGGSLWAVLQAIVPEGVSLAIHLPLCVASVALALAAGFLSLIPGGAGVREMVLLQLLKRPFGDVVAVVCPVLLRLAWLAAELILSGVLYFAVRNGAGKSAEERLE